MSALAQQIAAAMKPERMDAFIEALERTGVVTIAANEAGGNRITFYVRRQLDPVFAERWAKAKAIADVIVINEVRRRAIGGYDEVVYYQGVECGRKKIHSDGLLLMLAKGAAPELRDQGKVILSTPEDESKREDQFKNATEEQLREFAALAEDLGVGSANTPG